MASRGDEAVTARVTQRQEGDPDTVRIVAELGRLNSLMSELVAQTKRRDEPEATRPSLQDMREVSQLIDSLKPDGSRYDDDFVELKRLAISQLPTETLLRELCDLVLGVFGVENVGGFKKDFARSRRVIAGWNATLRIVISPSTIESVRWTGPATDQLGDFAPTIQQVYRIAPKLRDGWPESLGSRVSREEDRGRHGEHPIYNWEMEDGDGDYDMSVLSLAYNGSGYLQCIWERPTDYPETLCFSTQDMRLKKSETLGIPDDPQPWESDFYAKIWLFRARRESNILHFPLMALILSLMHIAVEPNGGGGVPGVFDPFWQRLATVNFLQIYAGPWRSVGSRRPKQAIVPHWSMWMHLYFVIRHFATSYDTVEGGDAATQGLCCDREAGMVQSLAGDTLSFRERRTLVALKTTTNLGSVSHAQLPFSTVLVVSDSELSLSITEDTWFQANLFPCREGSGIALFQLVVWCALDKWMAEWDECLGNIDEILKVKISDVVSAKARDDLMFDDSFQRSASYFTILQILRIFSDAIRESVADTKSMKRQWLRHYAARSSGDRRRFSKSAAKVLARNWDVLESHHEFLAAQLLSRIEKKTEEVTSLRDGLLNATSLREASRGLTLNQYILVFTILTIFYLPLSFVATIFGMHIFDKDDLVQNQISFYVTVVLMSILTYLISGFFLWRVSPEEGRARLASQIKSILRAKQNGTD